MIMKFGRGSLSIDRVFNCFYDSLVFSQSYGSMLKELQEAALFRSMAIIIMTDLEKMREKLISLKLY